MYIYLVFNTTFNIISPISWRSILLVEKLEYLEKTTDLPQVTDKHTVKKENNDKSIIIIYIFFSYLYFSKSNI